MLEGERYYQRKSSKFDRYHFSSNAKLVRGKVPDFFELVKKYSNKEYSILDLGCGSGELALKISPYFKKIIGIDPIRRYIETAKNDKKKKKVKNVNFIVAGGENLPFNDEYFNIIISSRGPLSLNYTFFREAKRVLKNKGLMVEETIGEEDKMEIKKIFGRGQNYPFLKTKLHSVKEILNKESCKILYSKYYKYYQNYHSVENVVLTLSRAPIIPDFKPAKDSDKIEKMRRELFLKEEILLSSHRLHWVAQKMI